MEYLNKLCFEGLSERYPGREEELTPRLEYELDVIKTMGYVDYFLIVWDYIHFAKEHDISVGPGRGSAAGSIVAYTMGITNIDPIRYNLIFERFLNPERVSMPDIDVDFCFERRQEVIDYVVEKYGKECVTQIVTFGTLAARGVIRDVGRVMDMPYAFVDSISKNVPTELGITIQKALEMNPDLRRIYEEDESVRKLIDMSKRLEGLPRHTSTHAAGVVISQLPMDEYVPLSRGTDGMITTQFTMTTLEELGLLKMDFLGLRTLTVINSAVHLVEKDYGVTVDIDHVDFDDQKVLEALADDSVGISMARASGCAPARISCYDDPQVAEDDMVMAMYETAQNAEPMPNMPEMDVMWTVAEKLLVDVNMSGKDVRSSAEDAQEQSLKLIQQMR